MSPRERCRLMTAESERRADSAWTAERLDALPEGTVIQAAGDGGLDVEITRYPAGWGKAFYLTGEQLLGRIDPGSIRVVSVPVNALLTEDAIEAAADAAWVDDAAGWSARAAIRAAIAHITGEAS